MAKTVKELKETHELYDKNVANWKLYLSTYEGINSIIDNGYITQHEREPDKAYERRINELYGYGYSKSIIKILNFFLFKEPTNNTLQPLEKEEQWQMFMKDANLYQDDFDTVMMRTTKYSSVLGQMGILVDKSSKKFTTIAEEKANNVYPYMAIYFPSNILDWSFEKDDNNRPYLAMIKLLNDDGTYTIWDTEKWEIWAIVEEEDGKKRDADTDEAELINSGINELGFIPFIWEYNNKSKDEGIGVSDLTEISRIDISIIKNSSQIEEVIDFAAFPMMLKASRDAKPDQVGLSQADDEVSVSAVQEYDPEYPEAKPEWMKTEVSESITSILENIEKKIAEIYRSSNVGGLASTEIQTQAKSGVALNTEFQMLNSELVAKAINLEKTENKVLEYWLKWQNKWDQYKDKVHFARSRSYDVKNLAIQLENALTAKTIVMSKTFNELLQKQTARQVLPSMTEDERDRIDEEISTNVEKMPDLPEETDENIDIIEDGMSEGEDDA